MKGQLEIPYLPKFANMMLIVMVIVITEILYIILIFDCFENQYGCPLVYSTFPMIGLVWLQFADFIVVRRWSM